MSKLVPLATPRVLSVGQCGFDHQSISGYLPSDSAPRSSEPTAWTTRGTR